MYTAAETIIYLGVGKPAADAPVVQVDKRLNQVGFTYNALPFKFGFKDTWSGASYIQSEGFNVKNNEFEAKFKLPSSIYTLDERNIPTLVANGKHAIGSSGILPVVFVESARKGQFAGIFFKATGVSHSIVVSDNELTYTRSGEQAEIFMFTGGSFQEVLANYLSVTTGYPTHKDMQKDIDIVKDMLEDDKEFYRNYRYFQTVAHQVVKNGGSFFRAPFTVREASNDMSSLYIGDSMKLVRTDNGPKLV